MADSGQCGRGGCGRGRGGRVSQSQPQQNHYNLRERNSNVSYVPHRGSRGNRGSQRQHNQNRNSGIQVRGGGSSQRIWGSGPRGKGRGGSNRNNSQSSQAQDEEVLPDAAAVDQDKLTQALKDIVGGTKKPQRKQSQTQETRPQAQEQRRGSRDKPSNQNTQDQASRQQSVARPLKNSLADILTNPRDSRVSRQQGRAQREPKPDDDIILPDFPLEVTTPTSKFRNPFDVRVPSQRDTAQPKPDHDIILANYTPEVTAPKAPIRNLFSSANLNTQPLEPDFQFQIQGATTFGKPSRGSIGNSAQVPQSDQKPFTNPFVKLQVPSGLELPPTGPCAAAPERPFDPPTVPKSNRSGTPLPPSFCSASPVIPTQSDIPTGPRLDRWTVSQSGSETLKALVNFNKQNRPLVKHNEVVETYGNATKEGIQDELQSTLSLLLRAKEAVRARFQIPEKAPDLDDDDQFSPSAPASQTPQNPLKGILRKGKPAHQKIEQARQLSVAVPSARSRLLNPLPNPGSQEEMVGLLNNSMATPTVDRFLQEVGQLVVQKNDEQLKAYLQIEPPFATEYENMIVELKLAFPPPPDGASKDEFDVAEKLLETKCSVLLAQAIQDSDGRKWNQFPVFMGDYLGFIRDVDVGDLMKTYNMLEKLLGKASNALGNNQGATILPTVIEYSKTFTRLALGLDAQPHLIKNIDLTVRDEEGGRESLPERAANRIREALQKCLPSGPSPNVTRPEGKLKGVYVLANICLKILWKTHPASKNAEVIFRQLDTSSPLLRIYPWPERVTFLFHLGRFHFMTNHFYRAILCLQEAFDNCPSYRLKQRRTILVYLVAASIIMGRFPSPSLYRLPEAKGFYERFEPICRAIKYSDLTTFRRLMSYDHANAPWFLHFKIFLQLENRCEILVYRSLARRVFLLSTQLKAEEAARAQAAGIEVKKDDGPPTLGLNYLTRAAQWLEWRYRNPISLSDGVPGQRHTVFALYETHAQPPNFAQPRSVHPDFTGLSAAELRDMDPDSEEPVPSLEEIECIVMSLIAQGLLAGFVSHAGRRFVINGMKGRGAEEVVKKGFRPVWESLREKAVKGAAGGEVKVPGWKTSETVFVGKTVHLAGARAAGE